MFARFARFSELARTRDLRLPPGAGLEAFRLWVEGALREEEGAAAGGCAVEGLECADRLADRLRLLWRDDNGVVDVLRLLCSHAAPHTQRLSFNFLGLYGHYTHSRPAGRDPKPTVEFRGMEGTMDPDTVVHWTRACVQLVRFAIDSGPTAYRRVLQNLTRRPPDAYTVLDLLLDVGCDPDTTGRHFAEKMSGGHFRCCNHSAEAAGDFVPARCPTHGR
ncbi:hypothetical protein VTK73DRAFT_3665 [Phialemonium thermophilum]|uniref:Uncharacterized protein n=1 Tax=Phialemonium thermophilum TaxID=223376 RepID=A0ABR3VG86_9PEZI